jgi:hypothetical protein
MEAALEAANEVAEPLRCGFLIEPGRALHVARVVQFA